MWTRGDIKSYAKDFLRRHYWKAFLVCLIVSLFSGGTNNSSDNNNVNRPNHHRQMRDNNQYEVIEDFNDRMMLERDNPVFRFANNTFKTPLSFITRGVLSLMTLILFILFLTVGLAIEVGQSRFFLQGFRGNARIGNLFSIFNSREYLPIIKTQFLRKLYNFLWTLLFIIPGIIKHYEYKFVPYVLSEQPNLSSSDVIQRSRDITRGNKMSMFILDLSFIGWYILGGLLFGIGVFFVDPYKEATYARLYEVLTDNLY